jgi:hypothetical protein
MVIWLARVVTPSATPGGGEDPTAVASALTTCEASQQPESTMAVSSVPGSGRAGPPITRHTKVVAAVGGLGERRLTK